MPGCFWILILCWKVPEKENAMAFHGIRAKLFQHVLFGGLLLQRQNVCLDALCVALPARAGVRVLSLVSSKYLSSLMRAHMHTTHAWCDLARDTLSVGVNAQRR